MSSAYLLRLLALFAVVSAVAGYTWPNPRLDALERLRYEQAGPRGSFIGPLVTPCNQFIFGRTPKKGGRTNAADWLRTAYHDMATYDAESGTGGLDASIQYLDEQTRPENTGTSFNNTVNFVVGATSRHVSLADAIALGAIYAVEGCGGPKIDFRGGRIDAKQAGPAGVPEPQGSLQSHTAAFARVGFTSIEMIQLVACGHTLGGVQSTAFPEIVPQSTVTKVNPDGQAPFDSKSDTYDNRIATEYISGRTKNPLAVGRNITTRSDARIFSSDGNVTMKTFAESPGVFRSTCATLFARMLDTVPRGVTLTRVIEPQFVKPTDISLVLMSNGSFSLSGSVRFWNLSTTSDASVRVLWADRSGKPCKGCASPLSTNEDAISLTFVGNHSARWFDFPQDGVTIKPQAGISRFWFEVTQLGKTWTEDQGGSGFPLQTDVLPVVTSCVDFGDTSFSVRLDISVRKGLWPSLVYVVGDSVQSGISATATTWTATLNQTASSTNSAYDIYTATLPLFSVFNVGATIHGQNLTAWTTFSVASGCS